MLKRELPPGACAPPAPALQREPPVKRGGRARRPPGAPALSGRAGPRLGARAPPQAPRSARAVTGGGDAAAASPGSSHLARSGPAPRPESRGVSPAGSAAAAGEARVKATIFKPADAANHGRDGGGPPPRSRPVVARRAPSRASIGRRGWQSELGGGGALAKAAGFRFERAGAAARKTTSPGVGAEPDFCLLSCPSFIRSVLWSSSLKESSPGPGTRMSKAWGPRAGPRQGAVRGRGVAAQSNQTQADPSLRLWGGGGPPAWDGHRRAGHRRAGREWLLGKA
ncbi:uncharacterized protein LOC141519411 [Macrotis lagotis]|uniref:uncharacterized protein LOC141519411 n=1 Tax=Macrotis lagotis TaxID=92651 RepID=UPI003D69083F